MAHSPKYDYIVVGGGTAGLVVANRLSANPTTRVLVLEAGDNKLTDPLSLTPAFWQKQVGSDVDWKYNTTTQSTLNNRIIAQPQGKVLGGSSAINGLAFIPTSAAGIDYWGSLGNDGWNYSTLLPYYEKFRNLTYPDANTSDYLGFDKFPRTESGHGPLKASYTGTRDDPMPGAWVDAFNNLGWTPKTDPFSGTVQGGFTCASSIDPVSHTRTHSGLAYYLPASSRTNLELKTGVTVQKIILDKDGVDVTAKGVQWKVAHKTLHAFASKEVILAAGAYGSPKLLELSGIGDSRILGALGIDTIVNSPFVGKNLQDHLMTGISFEVKDSVQTLDPLRRGDPGVVQAALAQYAANKTGPLAIGGIGSFAVMPVMQFNSAEGQSQLRHLLSQHPTDPSIEQPVEEEHYKFVASTLSTTNDGSGAFWLAPALANFGNDSASNPVTQTGNFMTIGFTSLQPFSRGCTHIVSKDPTASPTIETNYFGNPLDLEIFARHLTFIEELVQTSPLKDLVKDPANGKRNSPFAYAKTLDQAKLYARAGTISNWHPVGTCIMLPREKGGVVGADLKVHGVAGLRIVDSSIMPVITRGNPQTTVYAVAERAADLILGKA